MTEILQSATWKQLQITQDLWLGGNKWERSTFTEDRLVGAEGEWLASVTKDSKHWDQRSPWVWNTAFDAGRTTTLAKAKRYAIEAVSLEAARLAKCE